MATPAERSRRWAEKQREQDPEGWKQKQKEYRATALKKRDRLKHNETQKVWSKQERLRVRNEILALLGGKCAKCPFDDPRALQVDHINGGGVKHYKNKTSSLSYYKGILASIKNGEGKYQLLCANC